MAAATLKSIVRWMEGQLDVASPCRALVQQVLTQLVQEANQVGSRYAGAQGPTIHEDEAWDSIMPTQQSIGMSETSGKRQGRQYSCSLQRWIHHADSAVQ